MTSSSKPEARSPAVILDRALRNSRIQPGWKDFPPADDDSQSSLVRETLAELADLRMWIELAVAAGTTIGMVLLAALMVGAL